MSLASPEPALATSRPPAARLDAVRRFNRAYTRSLGLLQDGLVDTPFSLTEARVIYELANAGTPVADRAGTAVPGTTATAVAATLGLDHGYLSRILKKFEAAGLVVRRPSAQDARQSLLSLTADGAAAFADLVRRAEDQVAALLTTLPEEAQQRLVAAMRTIETLVTQGEAPPAVLLRPHRAGDMGFVLASHARCYAAEYGWGTGFETLVAEIVAEFLRSFDAAREVCFIAERDGVPVGSAVLVNGGDGVAKLRLILVVPEARGLGLGRRLVEACIDFARARGYAKITLWTQSILVEARGLYASLGFGLVKQEPHCVFGHALLGETWELALGLSVEPPR
ncbi:bifunctional helix-turn-helix transcriptional regulator/GNAT family N-acetyltransferase [Rhodoplanes azumiensis]|uniref:GNAT family N-acetyltransferase n=1 Tax=Rhodoplanes azumiensis TaxID=1897628 RepID=A0ABW5API3_9BRAD